MRFQVPQFIEVEDKIIGPLTLKQFIYLAGGVGIIVVAFSFLPAFFAIILSIPVIALSLALAFYKINNKPFINIMESLIKYFLASKLYIWRKEQKKILQQKKGEESEPISLFVPKLSDSKLKELTWSLDINENSNPVTMKEKQKPLI